MYKLRCITLRSGIICMMAPFVVMLMLVSGCKKNQAQQDADKANQARIDSLEMANQKLQLANEFNQIDAEFRQYEMQPIELKNDSILAEYNQARERIEKLLKELDSEKRNNDQYRNKIKELEDEISTLRNLVKHYLEEIDRLNKENEGLKEENSQLTQRNEELSSQVNSQTQRNQELTQVVQRAEKLNLIGISLKAFNKKGKEEKNVTKATQLGVFFTISPNNTAKPGKKTFYVCIKSPEGALLKGNGTFSYEGKEHTYTAQRTVDYANNETKEVIYWDVNTSLTPGAYIVDIFCEGNLLASRSFELKK